MTEKGERKREKSEKSYTPERETISSKCGLENGACFCNCSELVCDVAIVYYKYPQIVHQMSRNCSRKVQKAVRMRRKRNRVVTWRW